MKTLVTLTQWTAVLLVIQEVYCACIPSYYQNNNYHTPILHKCAENTKSDVASYQYPHNCCNNNCQHVSNGYDTGSTSRVCAAHKLPCADENTGKRCNPHCSYCQTQEVHQKKFCDHLPTVENKPVPCGYPVYRPSGSTQVAEVHRPCAQVNCGHQQHRCQNVDNCKYHYQPPCSCQQQNITRENPPATNATTPAPTKEPTTTTQATTTARLLRDQEPITTTVRAPPTASLLRNQEPVTTTTPRVPFIESLLRFLKATTTTTPKPKEPPTIASRMIVPWTFPVHPHSEHVIFYNN